VCYISGEHSFYVHIRVVVAYLDFEEHRIWRLRQWRSVVAVYGMGKDNEFNACNRACGVTR